MQEPSEYMDQAAKEALEAIENQHGGPFGAVLVKDGKILVSAHNMVIETNDPTAHAEIVAIREASKLLGRFDLSDCELYSSCEPCPMCVGAIHWAKMKVLYYGCSNKDAEDIGFDNNFISEVIKGTTEKLQVESKQVERDICLVPFEEWRNKTAKVQY